MTYTLRFNNDIAWTSKISLINDGLFKSLGMLNVLTWASLEDLTRVELDQELQLLLGRATTPAERESFEQMVVLSQPFAKDKRRKLCSALADPTQLVERPPNVNFTEVFNEREMLLSCVASRSGRAPSDFPVASTRKRESKEIQRNKLIAAIGAQLEECNMPVVQIFMGSAAPERLLGRLGAGKRLGTLKAKVREFRAIKTYMLAAHGCVFPSKPVQLLDYIMERGLEPCGPTVPSSILSCVNFYEELGNRKVELRIACLDFVKALVSDLRLELSVSKGAIKRKAFQYFIVMICSWELEVMDSTKTDVYRVLFWSKLVSIWGAFRTGDKSGIPPEQMEWIPEGLLGDITLTKTTGSGKRVGCLKFGISKQAFFLEATWLHTGWCIYKQYHTARKFFLPLPLKDGSGFSDQEPSYIQQVAADKRLCALTMCMERSDPDDTGFSSWKLTEVPLLEGGSQNLWSGHSGRATLPSWAAAARCTKEETDTVGRWCPEDSQEYVRTSIEVAMRVQCKVANHFKAAAGTDIALEAGLLRSLAEFLSTRGADTALVEEMIFRIRDRTEACLHSSGSDPHQEQAVMAELQEATIDVEDLADAEAGVHIEPEPQVVLEQGQYYVSLNAMGAHQTIHRQGKCYRLPGVHVTRFVTLDEGEHKEGDFQRVCKDCFPGGKIDEAVSSSSGTESISDSDDDSDSD